MMVAPVCHVGDPLQITCTASTEFIRWSVLHFNEQGTLVEAATPVQINSRDSNQMREIDVASATFTYTRSSAQGVSPLISTLSIDSVSIGLNGTIVCCSDVANSLTSASTTIQIIDSELALVSSCCHPFLAYFTSYINFRPAPIHSNAEHFR